MAKTVIYQEDQARQLDVTPTEDGRVLVAIKDRNGNTTDWGVLTLDNWAKLCRALNQELEMVAGIDATEKRREAAEAERGHWGPRVGG